MRVSGNKEAGDAVPLLEKGGQKEEEIRKEI